MVRIDTLLLLALPASGKSEIRRYLDHVPSDVAARDFGLGNIVQLDDYPYVRMMQLLDRELTRAGTLPTFFQEPNGLLQEPREWGTLARLLAEDFSNLGSAGFVAEQPVAHLLERIDRARLAVGAAPATRHLAKSAVAAASAALDGEVASFLRSQSVESARYDDSSTVVVEFARGGPQGAMFPLPEPHGYGYTLPQLGSDLLGRAGVLYIWVTPEESRRRNRERAGPGPEEDASMLHHLVPEVVMRANYGSDDLPWLISEGAGTVAVESDGQTHRLPAALLDNRVDGTSFLRDDPSTWRDDMVKALHDGLTEALGRLRSQPDQVVRPRS